MMEIEDFPNQKEFEKMICGRCKKESEDYHDGYCKECWKILS